VDDKEMRFLLSKELLDLSAKELEHYTDTVLSTIGSTKDFKYFFPRIFECLLEEQFNFVAADTVFTTMIKAGWESWPQEEKNVVLDLADKKFSEILDNCAVASVIDEWLWAITYIKPGIEVYLHRIESSPGFIRFVEYNNYAEQNRGFQNSLEGQQFLSWLKSQKVAKLIVESYSK